MSTLTSFLKNNDEVRETYVKVGTAVVNALAVPLEMFLAHLLEVQGIDPKNATPNQFLKDALSKALEQVDDPEELPEDFDVDWVIKHYAKARDRLNNLTREAYHKMTDLTHIADREDDDSSEEKVAEQWAAKAVSAVTEGKPAVYTARDVEDIQKFAKNKPPLSTIQTDSLKEALETLAKYAHKLSEDEGEEKPTVSVPRQVSTFAKARKAKKKASVKLMKDVHPEEGKVERHRVNKKFGGPFRRTREE